MPTRDTFPSCLKRARPCPAPGRSRTSVPTAGNPARRHTKRSASIRTGRLHDVKTSLVNRMFRGKFPAETISSAHVWTWRCPQASRSHHRATVGKSTLLKSSPGSFRPDPGEVEARTVHR